MKLQSPVRKRMAHVSPQCDLGHEGMTLGTLLNLCKLGFFHL